MYVPVMPEPAHNYIVFSANAMFMLQSAKAQLLQTIMFG